MKRSTADVLTEKKAVAEGLGAMLIVMTLLVAVGAVVANYGVLSKKASYVQAVTQDINNRAQEYAGELNADLVNPVTPSTARKCSPTTQTCTQIVSTTPSADGANLVLRIQGDASGALGTTMTKDITLISNEVTHVTGIDDDGNNVWALSDEGLRYRAWGVAEGTPSTVKPEDLAGPAVDNRWVYVDDRAGIDATGGLWGWGKNDVGQVGVGYADDGEVDPQHISPGNQQFRSVTTNDDRGYAIDSAGNAWVWGKNDKGQLGLGHTNNVSKPTKVPGARFMSFSIGKDSVMAITTSGELMHAGQPQRGFDDTVATTSFRAVNPGTRYTAVAASIGNGGAAAIRADGALVINGGILVPPLTAKFVAVARGTSSGFAISTAGELWAWGQGTAEQLGRPTTDSLGMPYKVPTDKKFVSVQGTENGLLAIDTHGGLHYSGLIAYAQAGGGDLPRVTKLTPLMPELRFRQISSNDNDSATALLDTSGALYGMSTRLDGLWSIGHVSTSPLPIRMTDPDGFDARAW